MTVLNVRQAATFAALYCILGSTPADAQSAGQPPAFSCPAGGLWPVGPSAKLPGVVTAIVPPLRILDALAHDKLNDLPKRTVAFHVVEADGKPVSGARVAVVHQEHRRLIHDLAGNGPAVPVPHGVYAANAVLAMKDGTMRWGTAETSVSSDGPAAVRIMLTGTFPAAVVGEIPRKAKAGTMLSVALSGLSSDFATLSILKQAEPGAKSGASEVLVDSANRLSPFDKPLTVALPGRPGKYESRVFLCAPRLMLARSEIEIERPDIKIAAPDRVPIATMLQISIRGSLSSAQHVEMRNTNDERVALAALGESPDQKVELAVPFDPGRYGIRVTAKADSVTLAHRAVTVETAPLRIEGPDQAGLGSDVRFSWPRSETLELQLWAPAAAAKPARQVRRLRPEMARLVAPPGHYELRLVKREFDTGRILARRPFRVEGKAFVSPPTAAAPGETLAIRLALTGRFFDRVRIVRRGEPDDPFSRLPNAMPSDKTTVTLTAPAEPGSYDLIYVMGTVGERDVVERVPLDVR
jgi:hypothetical protein